jgi:hypothetical protein
VLLVTRVRPPSFRPRRVGPPIRRTPCRSERPRCADLGVHEPPI